MTSKAASIAMGVGGAGTHLLARPQASGLEDGWRGYVDVLEGVGKVGQQAAEVRLGQKHVLLGEQVGAREEVLPIQKKHWKKEVIEGVGGAWDGA